MGCFCTSLKFHYVNSLHLNASGFFVEFGRIAVAFFVGFVYFTADVRTLFVDVRVPADVRTLLVDVRVPADVRTLLVDVRVPADIRTL
ncbi:hypothetical protein F3157_18500 [Virgibacillus dakarensis]|nr:hypothetical protein [Virgibacillus dakarensis]MTW87611.1 hypothetical protein [Virgibacillus dakarensis]